MASRLAQIDGQLRAAAAVGELENRTREDGSTGGVFKHKFDRHVLKIWFYEDEQIKERYAGAKDLVFLEGELLKAPHTSSKTVVVFMHPMGIQNLLPLPMALARCGVHVVTCTSRYPNNDSTLIMEKVVLDLAAVITHCRTQLGYSHVVVAGWSGGGSLAALYQSQAERPTITATPAGDAPDLSKAKLPKVDGLMMLAAHSSRARIMTEWLDPAVLNEVDPTAPRDLELDLYDDRNPNKPPFTPEYVARFRAAQIARNRRITEWALKELDRLRAQNDGTVERCFIVHGTMADPRWMDLSLEPNLRKGPNWCFMGLPKSINTGPVGVARFCTLRSWLSQWSYDLSNADALVHLPHVTCPVLVVANEADDAVPDSHPRAIHAAITKAYREFKLIPGANHYYAGQRDKQEEACRALIDWMNRKGLMVPPMAL